MKSRSRCRSLTLAWTLVLLVGVSVVSCSPAFPPPPDTNVAEVIDTIQGVSISDPYRWLENQESAETREWIDRQNAYAEQIVGESALREDLRGRLRNWMGFDDIGSPQRGGDFEYFTMRSDDQEVPVIYRRPAPPEGELQRVDPEGDYEVVIDPHEMASDHTTRVDIQSISSDGKLLAYSIRDGGQDETEVRVWDVEKRTDLLERLPRALELKEKVDKGETLNDIDIAFLEQVFSDANKLGPLLERHNEYQKLVSQAVELYSEITEKALANEKNS